jgi:hypothetical protein
MFRLPVHWPRGFIGARSSSDSDQLKVIYSRRQALDHRIIKIQTQKKSLFNLCVFSATPLLPSIVDSENHIFLAVLETRA